MATGQEFDRFGLGIGHLNYLAVLVVGHLNYLAVPGIEIFEFLFVPVTINHFPGWGIAVIFYLTFLPRGRKFAAIFWKMSNPCPMPCLPLPPCQLDIDRCIKWLSCDTSNNLAQTEL